MKCEYKPKIARERTESAIQGRIRMRTRKYTINTFLFVI